MRSVFALLMAFMSYAVAGASPLREIRAAWLVPSVDECGSVNDVRRVADAGFNTVLIRMQSSSGVWWPSVYEDYTVTASLADSDVPMAMIGEARDRRLAAYAVVRPDGSADADSLSMLYREMQLMYGFDGIVIDISRLVDMDFDDRYHVIDRLTLDLTNEFPHLATAVAYEPGRSGAVAREASMLLDRGIVDAVYLTDVTHMPPRQLSEQWGDIDGVVVTYKPGQTVDARFQQSPWGIAWSSPDMKLCSEISGDIFTSYAHLPVNEMRPTVPDVPVDVVQEYDGATYRITWKAPEYIDEEAPVSYYSVSIGDSFKQEIMPKTTAYVFTYPSDNPSLRFHVTAWDVNSGCSEPVAARIASDASDDMMADDSGHIEIVCVNSHLKLKSRQMLGTVEIYDLQGLIMKSRRINRMSASINCSDLAPGVYIVVMRGENEQAISRKFLLK